ncbi:hypothetical protein EXIGLDRAFT_374945 [Exidia glandulosa HHB12029]|uniref:Homeobox domain-containing protein n=1 Tax=Exidia glandulosa HHB12029 TaxID=1314781 RepID=A0A165PZ63_EXIGL|nr:hypothetical protein EXIGLDRAFT_374945 [Exidia glandulosa HHB12029]
MPMEAHDSHSQDQRTHAARRDSLRIDSSAIAVHTSSLESPDTPASSRPRSSTTQYFAHDSPLQPSPTNRTSRPSTATSTKSSAPETAKRKRSRVTPEQLAHLERIFAQDRSPTAARRKEISEMLGMNERQTQIWFQNRRAKAKNQDGKGKVIRHSPSSSPPETSPDAKPSSVDLDRQMLIHEEHPVNFIPCDDLTIGNWRRIASSTTRNDLLAYSCDAKRCVTWFIQSTGFSFKMEIPYDVITRVEFRPVPARPEVAQVTFYLCGVPTFFLDRIIPSPHALGGALRSWQNCRDWTEGGQASTVVRHDIYGPLTQMHASLSKIPLGPRIVGLAAQPLYESAMPLQLPPPPLMTLPTAPPVPMAFSPTDPVPTSSASIVQGRKRSFSGPPPHSQYADDGQQPPYTGQPGQPGPAPPTRPSSLQFNIPYPGQAPQYPGTVFRYAPPPLSQHSQHSTPTHSTPPPMDFSAHNITHTGPPYPGHIPASADVGLVYEALEHRQDMGSFSSASSGHSFGSSSPPLLTQPFHPGTGATQNLPSQEQQAMPMHMEIDPSILNSMNAYVYSDEPMSAESMRPPTSLGEPSSSSSSLDGALGLSMSQSHRTPPQ